MSRVHTRFDLRFFVKLGGCADFAQVEFFDELESAEAMAKYDREVSRGRAYVDTERTITSDQAEETTGVVRRVVVELIECKTDGNRTWDSKVVGEDVPAGIEGMRTLLEARPEPRAL